MEVVESALAIVGIPSKRADQYKEALKAGRFLVLVHGNAIEIHRAKSTLTGTQATCVESFTTKPGSKRGGLPLASSLL